MRGSYIAGGGSSFFHSVSTSPRACDVVLVSNFSIQRGQTLSVERAPGPRDESTYNETIIAIITIIQRVAHG